MRTMLLVRHSLLRLLTQQKDYNLLVLLHVTYVFPAAAGPFCNNSKILLLSARTLQCTLFIIINIVSDSVFHG